MTFVAYEVCRLIKFVALWSLLLIGFVTLCPLSLNGLSHYNLCHLWRLLHYDVCRLWRLSHYDVCHLWRLSHYGVCHLWLLSHYDVCHIMTFVPLWRLSLIGFVTVPFFSSRFWLKSKLDWPMRRLSLSLRRLQKKREYQWSKFWNYHDIDGIDKYTMVIIVMKKYDNDMNEDVDIL